jgi:glycosyltransferase involved in cell wall biosynthesis
MFTNLFFEYNWGKVYTNAIQMLSFVKRQIINVKPLYIPPDKETVLFMCFPNGSESSMIPKWNGDTLRNGETGTGGTQQSTILMAEALVTRGYNVFVGCDTCINNTTINGVRYISSTSIYNLDHKVDILVITPWIDPTQCYTWSNLKTLVYWCHTKQFGSEVMFKNFKEMYPKCSLIINSITNFTKSFLDKFAPYNTNYSDKIVSIRNPILPSTVYNKKIPHSFIFHSSFDRGGELMYKAYKGLTFGDKSLTVCSYIPWIVDDIIGCKMKSMSKYQLYNTLSSTEYYVYPGVSKDKFRLTKETDCCAVAEALLHEVIVFAFPVGALKENFGDCIIWIPFPSNAKLELIHTPVDSYNPELFSDEVVLSIQKLIYEIDSDTERKNDLKRRGKELILKQRDINTIVDQFISIL